MHNLVHHSSRGAGQSDTAATPRQSELIWDPASHVGRPVNQDMKRLWLGMKSPLRLQVWHASPLHEVMDVSCRKQRHVCQTCTQATCTQVTDVPCVDSLACQLG